MAKKEQLFQLIHSMSKSEKRHFKLMHSGQSASKNYLRLFDAIDRQQRYDEEALRKKFNNERFTTQMHVTKNYLRRMILKSLRNYHSRSSKDFELKNLLQNIELLYRRELFDHCRQEIGRAEKLALEFEKHHELLEIYAWKRKLLLIEFGPGKPAEELHAAVEAQSRSLLSARELNRYWKLTMDMFAAFGAADRATFLENDLLSESAKPLSLQSRVLYHYIRQAWYFAAGEPDKSEAEALRLIELLERHPQRVKDEPSSYITALNNLIGLYLTQKKYERIPELLQKIRNIPKEYGLDARAKPAVRLRLHSYNVELEMYRDTGDVRKGIALVNEIKEYLKSCRQSVPPVYRLMFYYQFAYLYFLDEEYSEAMHWLNELQSGEFANLREDVRSYAHLLRLIIHFELGNITILKYAVDACRRFLKSKRELHGFEQQLLRFFSKISTAPTVEYPKLLEELKANLFAGDSEQVVQNALDYLNFRRWLDRRTLKQGASK